MRHTGFVGLMLLVIGSTSTAIWAQGRGGQRPPVMGKALNGDLAQLMRGILFPNSNLLFDVQENDPGRSTQGSGGTWRRRVANLRERLADACSNCHEVYRDKAPAGSPARCAP